MDLSNRPVQCYGPISGLHNYLRIRKLEGAKCEQEKNRKLQGSSPPINLLPQISSAAPRMMR